MGMQRDVVFRTNLGAFGDRYFDLQEHSIICQFSWNLMKVCSRAIRSGFYIYGQQLELNKEIVLYLFVVMLQFSGDFAAHIQLF